MKIELSIEKRIFLLLIIFLFIPGLIVTTIIFHKTQNILKQKYKLEITEKKKFIKNYFLRQHNQLIKILNQLSYNRDIFSIYKDLIIYNDIKSSADNLKKIAKNLDFTWAQLYNQNKKFLFSSNLNKKIIIPKNLFKNFSITSYINIDKTLYLICITPLYIGEIEKNIYGYLGLIKRIDKKYLKKLKNLFNSQVEINITLTNKFIPKNYSNNFKPISIIVGKTIIGEFVILTCWYDISFFRKFAGQEKLFYFYLISGLFFFCVLIAYLLAKSLLNPLKNLDKMISELTKGKFYFNKLTYTIKDEIYHIIENLNTLFVKIKNSFSTLIKLTKEEKILYKSLSEKVEILSKNKKSINENAIKLSNVCLELSNELKDVNSNISNISENYSKTENIFKKISELTDNGFNISRVSNITFKEINRNSEAIKNILNFITDISSQINLLSVNASIEAIKSGDAGSGFSVVADEIKRLAQTTNEFVENIKKLIENNYNIVKQGAEYSQELDNILDELNQTVGEAIKIFSSIKSITLQQKNILNEIVKKLEYPINLNNIIALELKNIDDLVESFDSELNKLITLNQKIYKILNNFIKEEKK